MSVRRLAPKERQPESFEFTPENLKWAKAQLKKYPEGRQASAVIPLLWRAQEQHDGWLPEPAIRYVGELLDMQSIRVLEIATFYTMFNLSPVGKFFFQLCGTTPCMLRGSESLIAVLKEEIGEQGTVTQDGLMSWLEVECLGACVNAPMIQINHDYFEDLTAGSLRGIIQAFRDGKVIGHGANDVNPGPQIKRQKSAPKTGLTSLVE